MKIESLFKRWLVVQPRVTRGARIASVVINAVTGIGKVLTGIISLSFFVVMNGVYNIGVALAKYICMKERVQTDRVVQLRKYRLVGIVITVASLAYVAYGIYLTSRPLSARFTPITAVVVLVAAVIELGVNAGGSIRLRRFTNLLDQANSLVSLVASLITLVIAQAALRYLGGWRWISGNGGIGIIVGAAATMIGLSMVVYATLEMRKASASREQGSPIPSLPCEQARFEGGSVAEASEARPGGDDPVTGDEQGDGVVGAGGASSS